VSWLVSSVSSEIIWCSRPMGRPSLHPVYHARSGHGGVKGSIQDTSNITFLWPLAQSLSTSTKPIHKRHGLSLLHIICQGSQQGNSHCVRFEECFKIEKVWRPRQR